MNIKGKKSKQTYNIYELKIAGFINTLAHHFKKISNFMFCLNLHEIDKITIIKRLKQGMKLLLEQ